MEALRIKIRAFDFTSYIATIDLSFIYSFIHLYSIEECTEISNFVFNLLIVYRAIFFNSLRRFIFRFFLLENQ